MAFSVEDLRTGNPCNRVKAEDGGDLVGGFRRQQTFDQEIMGTRPADSRALHLGTFGDTQLLDFLPLPVNAMAQQHGLIAQTALELALAAVEQKHYQPGIHAVARTFKQRIFKG